VVRVVEQGGDGGGEFLRLVGSDVDGGIAGGEAGLLEVEGHVLHDPDARYPASGIRLR
jgi:hypothetical protein